METCNSGPKDAVLHSKTTNEGWDPQILVNLMLITLFCVFKMTGEVWDSWSLVRPVLITLFCLHKTTGEV